MAVVQVVLREPYQVQVIVVRPESAPSRFRSLPSIRPRWLLGHDLRASPQRPSREYPRGESTGFTRPGRPDARRLLTEWGQSLLLLRDVSAIHLRGAAGQGDLDVDLLGSAAEHARKGVEERCH